MTSIDPATLARRERSRLMNGLVAPRPVAWVSTVSPEGERNLAPFSFFNLFSYTPPVLAVGPGRRSGVEKDSLRNLTESGEFVVNMVDEALAVLANASSAEFEPGVDEWAVLGLEGTPSDDVAPDRVTRAPAALECRVRQIIDLGTEGHRGNALVIADVTRVHVRDDALDGLVPVAEKLRLVARMGGNEWSTTRDRFELVRPVETDPEVVRRSISEPAAERPGPADLSGGHGAPAAD